MTEPDLAAIRERATAWQAQSDAIPGAAWPDRLVRVMLADLEEELRLRILRELRALHAAAFRAGQERMRERAGEALETPTCDVLFSQDVRAAAASLVRALPLEEAE